MDEETTQTAEEVAKPEETPTTPEPTTAADKGCCVVFACFVLFDLILVCGVISMLLVTFMKLWLAVTIGIPVGIGLYILVQRAVGTQDMVDFFVTRVILIVLACAGTCIQPGSEQRASYGMPHQ